MNSVTVSSPSTGPQRGWDYWSTLDAIRGTPTTARDRLLVFVEECHLTRKDRIAEELARSHQVAQPARSVRLFLEALPTHESNVASQRLGLHVTGINRSEFKKAYWSLGFAYGMLRFYRTNYALQSPAESRSALITEEARSALALAVDSGMVKPPKAHTPMSFAIIEMLVTDVGYAVTQMQKIFPIEQKRLGSVLKAASASNTWRAPPAFRNIIVEILNQVPAADLAGLGKLKEVVNPSAASQVEPLVHWKGDTMRQLGTIIEREDTEAAFVQTRDTFNSLRALREQVMSLSIAKASFDMGFFNCGMGHARSEALTNALKKSNIHVLNHKHA
jgi:hypothetical protein